MSGGHFDYKERELIEIADKIHTVDKTKEEKELSSILREMSRVLESYDYWKSGDHCKENFISDFSNFKKFVNVLEDEA